jgi:Resolvase, N terminal domain
VELYVELFSARLAQQGHSGLEDIQPDGSGGWYVHFSSEPATAELLRTYRSNPAVEAIRRHSLLEHRYALSTWPCSVVRTRFRDMNFAMTTCAIIYARASAECPASVEEQVDCLRAVANSHGWTVTRAFTDQPMRLKRGREQRPREVALVNAIRSGGVDKVLLFSIDRIGKSLVDLVGYLETCRAAGVEVYIPQHSPELTRVCSFELTR